MLYKELDRNSDKLTFDEVMAQFGTLVAPRIGIPMDAISVGCLSKIFHSLDDELSVENFDRFLDVCRCVHQAKMKYGWDFETSVEEDAEVFVLQYAFRKVDKDDSGTILFMEFWRKYDVLVRNAAIC